MDAEDCPIDIGDALLKKCAHFWVTVDQDIVADFQKGTRDSYSARGDYQECSHCPEGRFVPYESNLKIVFCEKIPAHDRRKKDGHASIRKSEVV